MNLVTGRILELYIEGGITRARVNVGGAQFRVEYLLKLSRR